MEELLLGFYRHELERAMMRAAQVAEARAAKKATANRRGLGRVLSGRFGSRAASVDEHIAA